MRKLLWLPARFSLGDIQHRPGHPPAGPMAAARWTGFQNAFGSLAGIVSPIVTGWIVGYTGRFAFAFPAASLACVAGAASFGLLVRDSEAPGAAGLRGRG